MKNPSSDTLLKWCERALLLVSAIGIAALWDAYGISWDDSIRARHGEMIREYFLSLGQDREAVTDDILRFYPALPDLIAALIYQWAPEARYAVRHTVNATFALATVPALFRLAALLRTPWSGPVASGLLLTTPVYFGHGFINSKDIPLAATFAWAMVAIAWLFDKGGFSWRRVVLTGLAVGLPLTIRPGILPLLGILLLAMILHGRLRKGEELLSARKLAVLLLVAWMVMVLPWPWAHTNPILHPLMAIVQAGAFPTVVPVLFDGTVWSSDALPRRYLAQMFLLKIPLPHLILALLGLGGWLYRLVKGPQQLTPTEFLLVAWSLVPLAAWTVMTPNTYDGVRHFLFLLPGLALAGGWAAVTALRLARSAPQRFLATALVGVSILSAVPALISLHPYEMTYYNRIVGGVGGADGRYETEYWVTSYREAAEWISDQPAPEDRAVRVLVAANQLSEEAARFYLPSDAVVELLLERTDEAELPCSFDYYISTYRYRLAENFGATPIVYRVGREGATFAVVRGKGAVDPDCDRAPDV